VRNVDIPSNLSERRQRVRECEEKLNLLESGWSDIVVRTVNQRHRGRFGRLVALEMNIILIHTEDRSARVGWVNTQIVL